jgi:hypothetical protein
MIHTLFSETDFLLVNFIHAPILLVDGLTGMLLSRFFFYSASTRSSRCARSWRGDALVMSK